MPIDGDGAAFPVALPSHGKLFLAAFKDAREMRKRFKTRELSSAAKERPYSGLNINPDGERLVVTRSELERIGRNRLAVIAGTQIR